MNVQALGHVVLKVRDLSRSESFYADTLGIAVVGRIAEPVRMTFFSLGRHHDLALVELDGYGFAADPRAVGLAHVAFELAGSITDLQAARRELETAGVTIRRQWSSGFADSLFVLDPDGNEVELYVDKTADGTVDDTLDKTVDATVDARIGLPVAG